VVTVGVRVGVTAHETKNLEWSDREMCLRSSTLMKWELILHKACLSILIQLLLLGILCDTQEYGNAVIDVWIDTET